MFDFKTKIKIWLWRITLCLLLVVALEACADNSPKRKKPHGKLKKGGRIPCPLKDC